MTKIYTVKETCKLLRITGPTLYGMVNAGKLDSTKIGSRRLFSEAQVQKFIDSCAVKGKG